MNSFVYFTQDAKKIRINNRILSVTRSLNTEHEHHLLLISFEAYYIVYYSCLFFSHVTTVSALVIFDVLMDFGAEVSVGKEASIYIQLGHKYYYAWYYQVDTFLSLYFNQKTRNIHMLKWNPKNGPMKNPKKEWTFFFVSCVTKWMWSMNVVHDLPLCDPQRIHLVFSEQI